MMSINVSTLLLLQHNYLEGFMISFVDVDWAVVIELLLLLFVSSLPQVKSLLLLSKSFYTTHNTPPHLTLSLSLLA